MLDEGKSPHTDPWNLASWSRRGHLALLGGGHARHKEEELSRRCLHVASPRSLALPLGNGANRSSWELSRAARELLFVKSSAPGRFSTHFNASPLHLGVFKLLRGEVMVLLRHLSPSHTFQPLALPWPGGCRAETPGHSHVSLTPPMTQVPRHGAPEGLPGDSGRAGASALTQASPSVAGLPCASPEEPKPVASTPASCPEAAGLVQFLGR